MQIGVETSRAVENKRVFVVDSDEITRAALQFMLHDENETHELGSLEEAYAKSVGWKPDLILLGLAIVLQEGDGIFGEIAGRIPGVKILLVANPGEEADAQDGVKSGAHGILVKPLTVESVRRKVDILLGREKPTLISLQVLTPGAK